MAHRDAFHSEEWDSSDCEEIPPGYTVRVEFCPDDAGRLPWQEFDSHGDIRTASSWYGHLEKKPGERIIHSERGDHWIYDVQGAIVKATHERWGIGPEETSKLTERLGRPPSQREVIARAVALDMDYCAGWLDGRYSWCVVWATVLDSAGIEVSSDCVGGVEWDSHGANTYATEDTAGGVVRNALHEAGLTLAQRRAAWREALREARERRAWAARDVATV